MQQPWRAALTTLPGSSRSIPRTWRLAFGLGMIQFVRAVEKLCQAQYRYGIQQPDPHLLLPLLRFPIPPNRRRSTTTPSAPCSRISSLTSRPARRRSRKSARGRAAVVVDLMQVRLNVTGAIKSGEGIRLIDVIAAISGQSGRWPPEATKALDVKFNSGDAAWLRAYTHVLSALCEFLLAHDFHASFDAVAPHFWAHPKTPFAAELAVPAPPNMWTDFEPRPSALADLIAAIHLLNWPVVAPERMLAARTHLLAMITDEDVALSWELIDAETGDDRESNPDPHETRLAGAARQPGADDGVVRFPRRERGDPRGPPAAALALRKGHRCKGLLREAQSFDVVLFVTGQGALPYCANRPIALHQSVGRG